MVEGIYMKLVKEEKRCDGASWSFNLLLNGNIRCVHFISRMQRFETISFGLKHNFSKELKEKVQVLFNKMVSGEKYVTREGLCN